MRRRRTRRERKRQKQLIIFSMIGVVCLFNVGYAAFSSNFLVSGKGIIVEKPITIDELKETKVTANDGLYEDVYEENKYIYRGVNPNNFILFNDELWRIIGIENGNNLKIIRNESIGNIAMDPGYSTSISGVTAANSVEGTRYTNVNTDYCYYNSGKEASYYGCNVWGSKNTMIDSSGVNITKMPKIVGESAVYDLPEEEAYLNTYLNGTWYHELNAEAKSLINNHTWNVGQVKLESGQTLNIDLNQESSYKWNGKVGLVNITDYAKTNLNQVLCGSVYANTSSAGNYETCKITNWLFNSSIYWTMSPNSYSTASLLWDVHSSGVVYNNINAHNSILVRPVVHLKSEIKLSGKGTKEKPYIIVN